MNSPYSLLRQRAEEMGWTRCRFVVEGNPSQQITRFLWGISPGQEPTRQTRHRVILHPVMFPEQIHTHYSGRLPIPLSKQLNPRQTVEHMSTGEMGIVMDSWDMGDRHYDNYVCFYGNEWPKSEDGEPEVMPYVLRYSNASLKTIGSYT